MSFKSIWFHMPTEEDVEGKGKEGENESSDTGSVQDSSAVQFACEALGFWDSLWDVSPFLLATVLEFLEEVVWRHAPEHRSALEPGRAGTTFWEAIAGIARRGLGPKPD